MELRARDAAQFLFSLFSRRQFFWARHVVILAQEKSDDSK